MKKEEEVKIKLRGDVQGVGMRYFIKTNAQALNLKGYVQNNQDGSVTCLVLGYKKDIQSLIHQIKHQAPGDIDDMTTMAKAPSKTYDTFSVRR